MSDTSQGPGWWVASDNKMVTDPNTDETVWGFSVSASINGQSTEFHLGVTQSTYDTFNVGDSVSCDVPSDGSPSTCQ